MCVTVPLLLVSAVTYKKDTKSRDALICRQCEERAALCTKHVGTLAKKGHSKCLKLCPAMLSCQFKGF